MRQEGPDGIGRAACATPWLGDSLAGHFTDPAFFAELSVRTYLEVGVAAFVAEETGRVLGYAMAARTWDLPRWFLLPPRFGLIPRLLDLPTSERKLLWGLLTAGAPHASFRAYPAALHIHLLPEAQGKALGKASLSALSVEGFLASGSAPPAKTTPPSASIAALAFASTPAAPRDSGPRPSAGR